MTLDIFANVAPILIILLMNRLKFGTVKIFTLEGKISTFKVTLMSPFSLSSVFNNIWSFFDRTRNKKTTSALIKIVW